MSKMEDLRLVLSAVDTSGILSLQNALNTGLVCHGRFFNHHGQGCLIHWASGQQVVDRPSRVYWEKQQGLLAFDGEVVRRVIAGWDAAKPEGIIKGPYYDVVYPKPSYVIEPKDVLQVIDEVLAARATANAAEDAAVELLAV